VPVTSLPAVKREVDAMAERRFVDAGGEGGGEFGVEGPEREAVQAAETVGRLLHVVGLEQGEGGVVGG
jgi:hypothetical protein